MSNNEINEYVPVLVLDLESIDDDDVEELQTDVHFGTASKENLEGVRKRGIRRSVHIEM